MDFPPSPASDFGSPPAFPLSAREREIVRLIALGFTSKGIAGRLGISQKTVESHRTNIFLKGHFRCIADVTRYAIRVGIIEP